MLPLSVHHVAQLTFRFAQCTGRALNGVVSVPCASWLTWHALRLVRESRLVSPAPQERSRLRRSDWFNTSMTFHVRRPLSSTRGRDRCNSPRDRQRRTLLCTWINCGRPGTKGSGRRQAACRFCSVHAVQIGSDDVLRIWVAFEDGDVRFVLHAFRKEPGCVSWMPCCECVWVLLEREKFHVVCVGNRIFWGSIARNPRT